MRRSRRCPSTWCVLARTCSTRSWTSTGKSYQLSAISDQLSDVRRTNIIMRNLARLVPALVLAVSLPSAALAQKRPLNVDDLYNLKEVRDPQRSPDGKWVAYAVSRAIKDTDKNDTDVWMVSWDGKQQIQITSTPEGESSPRWSPDGHYLAFLSSRLGAKDAQVWLMN